MLLKIVVIDWNSEYSRQAIEQAVLDKGLAQNFDAVNRPWIAGDHVIVTDPLRYLLDVGALQDRFRCTIAVYVG